MTSITPPGSLNPCAPCAQYDHQFCELALTRGACDCRACAPAYDEIDQVNDDHQVNDDPVQCGPCDNEFHRLCDHSRFADRCVCATCAKSCEDHPDADHRREFHTRDDDVMLDLVDPVNTPVSDDQRQQDHQADWCIDEHCDAPECHHPDLCPSQDLCERMICAEDQEYDDPTDDDRDHAGYLPGDAPCAIPTCRARECWQPEHHSARMAYDLLRDALHAGASATHSLAWHGLYSVIPGYPRIETDDSMPW